MLSKQNFLLKESEVSYWNKPQNSQKRAKMQQVSICDSVMRILEILLRRI